MHIKEIKHVTGFSFTKMNLFLFKALSVPSSGGDSWTKQVSYTGSEPHSEVPDKLETANICHEY